MAEAWRAHASASATGLSMFPGVDVFAIDNADGSHDWPPGELTQGIAGIQVHAYGDEPDGAGITVWGTDRAGVVATAERMQKLIMGGLVRAWFPPVHELTAVAGHG